jgi:hypothetical protein
MRKISLYIISLLIIVIIPFSAQAAGTATLSVSCGSVQIGQETSCTVYATPTAGIMAASGSINISGGAASFVSASSSTFQGTVNASSFNLYGTTYNSKVALFVIRFKGVTAGSTNVVVMLSYIGDCNFEDSNISVQGSGRVTVSAPATQPTNPTTKPTTAKPTTTKQYTPSNPGTTTTTRYVPSPEETTTTTSYIETPVDPSNPIDPNDPYVPYDPSNPNTPYGPGHAYIPYDPNGPYGSYSGGYIIYTPVQYRDDSTYYIHSKLYLTSLTVDEYPITRENGIYYVTTDSSREFVEINATAPEGVTIYGTGQRFLATGKNSVSIVLKDEDGNTATISLIITRPGDSPVSTLLKELGIVNYKLTFDPNTMEYTVSVPAGTEEVYIYATAENPDTVIMGDGIFKLTKGEGTAYVKVTYGNLSSTLYTIHFKKSNKALIPIILLSIGMLGGIGGIFFLINKLKQQEEKYHNLVVSNKADSQRSMKQAEPQITLNGNSSAAIGQQVVRPTAVPQIEQKQVPVQSIINNNVPNTPIKQNVNVAPTTNKVVDTKPVTTPGMVAPKVVPVNNLVANKPAPQVKVVKRVVTSVNTGAPVHQVQVNTGKIQ